MKNAWTRLTGNNLLLFILIFVFASFFYLFNIGFSDLWSDETYTLSMLDGSLADFYGKFRNDLHPPLYYVGLRLFTGIFGLSAVSLRVFSVLGILATLLLGYFAGQRVFGRHGALYFCLMLIAIPMLAVYAHQARMYTWTAFTVTGVFMYAWLFLKTGKRSDLVFLFVFSVAAIYIHYYSMAAALVANSFVFAYLVMTKNSRWVHHLIAMLTAALLFLPWLFMFMVQVKRVQHAFWAPEVSLQTLLSCLTIPFTEQFWTTGFSKAMTIFMYSLIALTILLSFTRSFSTYRLALWLSLTVFLGTLLLVTIISLLTKPILYSRYVVVIVTMLAVPATTLILSLKHNRLKWILAAVIVLPGLRIALSTFGFSYGPYKQTVEYIAASYPEIRKVLHITEVTAGPMLEYTGNQGLDHYWLKAEMSNVDAFSGIKQYNHPHEFLKPGEVYCAVRFHNLELNMENLDRALSESELIRTDTVRDNKVEDGIMIQVYLLAYKGSKTE